VPLYSSKAKHPSGAAPDQASDNGLVRRRLSLSRLAIPRELQIQLVEAVMTDPPIALDRHRGMAAQKATEIRRLLAEVEANEKTLRERQEELEKQLIAAPAATWPEAADKARYLLGLLATTVIAQDLRRKRLIDNVLEDFARLSDGKNA
jgi:hypothetical protein